MSYSLIAKAAAGSSDSLSVTTPAIDTTGATLLTAFLATNAGGTPPAITDNKGNTWTRRTAESVPGGERGEWFDCKNPTSVGAGHTASWTTDFAGSASPALAFRAYSGSDATSPFDQETGSSTFPNNLQPGSQTPSQDNCLVEQGLAFNVAATVSINESYNFAGDSTDYVNSSGTCRGLAVAYKIQTTAAATNPTWTLSMSASMAGRSASYKAAAGGGGSVGAPYYYRHLAGGSSV